MDIWSRFVADVEQGKPHLRERQRWLDCLRGFEGKTVEIAVRKARAKRTLPQNSKLHVLAHYIADARGEHIDKVKAEAVLHALGLAYLERHMILGKEILIPRGTSTLSVDECGKVMEWLSDKRQWLGTAVPPDSDVEVMS